MRLWTLHPKHLDARGLVALWREGLLAKKVLQGRTRGYRHHPQLVRFRAHASPVGAIETYLRAVYDEACRRGYAFDPRKLGRPRRVRRLVETRGQLAHEWQHLLAKLRARAPDRHRAIASTRRPEPHPLFRLVTGRVRSWERARPPAASPTSAPPRRRASD